MGEGIDKIDFPAVAQGDCEDLVKGLCKTEPTQRLPMTTGGVENIRKHMWFEGFDWTTMKSLDMIPPFIPDAKDPEELVRVDDDGMCSFYWAAEETRVKAKQEHQAAVAAEAAGLKPAEETAAAAAEAAAEEAR